MVTLTGAVKCHPTPCPPSSIQALPLPPLWTVGALQASPVTHASTSVPTTGEEREATWGWGTQT